MATTLFIVKLDAVKFHGREKVITSIHHEKVRKMQSAWLKKYKIKPDEVKITEGQFNINVDLNPITFNIDFLPIITY
jgi:hypothetical protein